MGWSPPPPPSLSLLFLPLVQGSGCFCRAERVIYQEKGPCLRRNEKCIDDSFRTLHTRGGGCNRRCTAHAHTKVSVQRSWANVPRSASVGGYTKCFLPARATRERGEKENRERLIEIGRRDRRGKGATLGVLWRFLRQGGRKITARWIIATPCAPRKLAGIVTEDAANERGS